MTGLVAFGVLIVAAVAFLYGAPERATRVLLDLERRRSGLKRKQITLPNSLHYAFLEGGKGEPLMLLHGFGGGKDNFTRAARYLEPLYRVIIPDHIGFGESAHPLEADYSPIAQAERLRALAHALGISRLHLGGNSMGGQVAMTYAALYPDEVRSLWLLDSAGVWRGPESDLHRIEEKTGRNPLLAKNEQEFAGLLSLVMKDPPFIPRPVLKVMARERIKNFPLEQRIAEQVRADSVEERVKGLDIPALIVWGGEDRVIDVAAAEVLHRLLPRSQVIILPGVGHLPMVERPRQTVQDYLRFRAGIAPCSGTT